MSYIISKLELYKRLDSGEGSWSDDAQVIDQFFGKIIRKASGNKKDTFKFNILNSYNKLYSSGAVFEKGDRIKIYQSANKETFGTEDMLIDGVITSIKNDNSTTKILTLNGFSRTEQFLEGVTFVTNSIEQSPATILQEALNFHNRNNKNFTITWADGTGTAPANPSTKEDLSAFPTYLVEDFYKPMFQLFEKYSSNQYTEDGQYYYYVNDDNELVWDKKKSTSDGTLTEDECEVVNINDNSDTVINSIVINCGRAPDGSPVRAYYYDHSSRAKNGAKWKYMTMQNNTVNDLINAEKTENGIGFDVAKYNYPQGSEYPFTTRWGVTVSSDSDWNTAIKTKAKDEGLKYGKSYADGINQSRLSVTAQLQFTTNYSLMQVLSCTFPSHGVTGKNLRITDIQYTDYNTILTLLEDIEE